MRALLVCPLLLLVALLSVSRGVAQLSDEQPVITLTDYRDGVTGYRYLWQIPRSLLKALPRWIPADAEPSLSPHKAAQIATDYLRQSVGPATKLTIYSVTLAKQGMEPDRSAPDPKAIWAYHISFSAIPEPAAKDKARLEVLVLLDGTLVQPEVSPLK